MSETQHKTLEAECVTQDAKDGTGGGYEMCEGTQYGNRKRKMKKEEMCERAEYGNITRKVKI